MIRYPRSILFMFIIVSRVFIALWTDHPVMTWVFLEIILISILAFLPSRAGVQYFLIQSFSSIIFFTGVLFTEIEAVFWLGMSLKLGISPIHWWVPLIYQEISWSSIFILAVVLKIIPLIILDIGARSESIIFLIIISRLVVGAVGGLRQTSIKKLLAYSSISHIGWLIRTLFVSTSISIIYLRIYALTILFLVVNPPSGIRAYIILLSLGGLPPLLGFFPKLIVLNAIWVVSVSLTVILVITTLISLVYYISLFSTFLLTASVRWDIFPLVWFIIAPLFVFPTLNLWGSFNIIVYYCNRLSELKA